MDIPPDDCQVSGGSSHETVQLEDRRQLRFNVVLLFFGMHENLWGVRGVFVARPQRRTSEMTLIVHECIIHLAGGYERLDMTAAAQCTLDEGSRAGFGTPRAVLMVASRWTAEAPAPNVAIWFEHGGIFSYPMDEATHSIPGTIISIVILPAAQ